ncbi:B3/B4 domain-containing protein [Fusibacter ferrireducens]|uniref:B3/B4 tRNA-binding domain-containing protein n=1 Tax=Fusibacter ferrireducens TaxID=2785058 RepID=A0ABR9ZVH3_9FIRM|nr:phenylalanine--tRNA ligase beta subunit-related protein [Fusibacter ferrireducens]MBF4694467.1 hypothetical protein [Fusibacter ferrireducens]
MMDIKIDSDLKAILPEIRLGVLVCDVVVTESSELLRLEMHSEFQTFRDKVTTADISKLANVFKARSCYRALGKDPTKYRVSSEKLMRRITRGEGVDFINNIVDLSNLVSVKSMNSVGTYDYDQIKGSVLFTRGRSGETYLNIGGQEMNLENLLILKDTQKPFGSTTADSKRTSVNETTQKIVMNIISLDASDPLEDHLDYAEQLLIQYGASQRIEKRIVK